MVLFTKKKSFNESNFQLTLSTLLIVLNIVVGSIFFCLGDLILISLLVTGFFLFGASRKNINFFLFALMLRLIWAAVYLSDFRIVAESSGLSDAIDYNIGILRLNEFYTSHSFWNIKAAYHEIVKVVPWTIHVFYYYYGGITTSIFSFAVHPVQIVDIFISSISVCIFISLLQRMDMPKYLVSIGGFIFAANLSFVFFSPTLSKDTVLVFCVLLSNLFYLKFEGKKRWFLIGILLFIIWFTRMYYVPILLFSFFYDSMVKKITVKRIVIFALIVCLIVVLIYTLRPWLVTRLFETITSLNSAYNVVYGIVKYISPALPWKLHGMWNNNILFLHCLFWLFVLPLSICGFFVALSQKMAIKIFKCQFLLMLLIGSILPNLQGVRHRIQIEPYLIIFLILAIYNLNKNTGALFPVKKKK